MVEHVAVGLYAAILRAISPIDWKNPEQVDLFTRALLKWNHQVGIDRESGIYGKSTD